MCVHADIQYKMKKNYFCFVFFVEKHIKATEKMFLFFFVVVYVLLLKNGYNDLTHNWVFVNAFFLYTLQGLPTPDRTHIKQ